MKVQGKSDALSYLFLMLFGLITSCGNSTNSENKLIDNNIATHSDQINQEKGLDCLENTDISQVNEFIINFSNAILKKEKEKLIQFINFPLNIENNMNLTEKEFLDILTVKNTDSFKSSIVTNILNYFSNETIDKVELDEMKESKTFNKDCSYNIRKTFPENEFSILFELRKYDKNIKLGKVRTAG